MTFSVKLSPPVANAYKKLGPSIKPDIRAALDALQHTPHSGPKIKRLKGRLRAYYRYRVGDYRIVYTIAHQEAAVYVDYIQHRRDVYRRMD